MKIYTQLIATVFFILATASTNAQNGAIETDLLKYCKDLDRQAKPDMWSACTEAFDFDLEVGDARGANLSDDSNAVIEVGREGETATIQITKAWLGPKLTFTAAASTDKETDRAEFIGFADRVGTEKVGVEFNLKRKPKLTLYRLSTGEPHGSYPGYEEIHLIHRHELHLCRAKLEDSREILLKPSDWKLWTEARKDAYRTSRDLDLPTAAEIDFYMDRTADRTPFRPKSDEEREIQRKVTALNEVTDDNSGTCDTAAEVALMLITQDLINRGALTSQRWVPIFGLNASVGRTEFSFLDRDLLETQGTFGKVSDNEYATSLGIRIGAAFFASEFDAKAESAIILSYNREHGYKAAKSVTFCEPAEGLEDFADFADCQDIARDAPSGSDSDLLRLEYRRKFKKVGIAGRAFYRTKTGASDDFGFEVPIYLADSKKNLQGGIVFGWSDQADDVTLAVFVGRKFKVF